MLVAYFYKGTRPGLPGVYNQIVRALDSGPFSHVELCFSDGLSASSSYADKGIRFKDIAYDAARWEAVILPAALEQQARQWFIEHEFYIDKRGVKRRTPYDLAGNLAFYIRPYRGEKAAYFCSEAIAAALSIKDPWRYSPNLLYSALLTINKNNGLLLQAF